ncbi:MAG: hypothetical protein ACLT46_14270 [Hungatella sp.]
MGLPVLIYGKSAAGRAAALSFLMRMRSFPEHGAELLLKKRFKKTGCSDDINRWSQHHRTRKDLHDDAGYIMTHLFMSQHRNKRNASLEMYV